MHPTDLPKLRPFLSSRKNKKQTKHDDFWMTKRNLERKGDEGS